MTTVKQPAHVPYEDASSPTQMHGDCAAVQRNIRVPGPRRASAVAGIAPVRAKTPAVAVSDRLARMADAIFDRRC